jgi:intracellular multiplication protein IcmJ
MSAKRGQWREKGGIESSIDDKEFAVRRPQALSRDSGRCRFCNVRLERMHVHHKNDDHSDNALGNLMTVCPMCHSVNHIGLLGKSGVVVYFNALNQSDLSHLFRSILVVIARGGEDAELAKKLASHLFSSFSKPVEEVFGTSNPADFGNALLLLSDSSYNSRALYLKDTRVMFRVDALSKDAGDIAKAVYPKSGDDIIEDWRRIEIDIDARAEMIGA